MKLVIIAAVSDNGIIGNKNQIPWRIPSDLKRFKELTMGHTLICGRKTYESIGKPLPGRRMAILSRSPEYLVQGYTTHTSLESALWTHVSEPQLFCIGGSAIYHEAIEYATELDITRVEATVEGDTYFPSIHEEEWELVSTSPTIQGERDEYPTHVAKYRRRGVSHGENLAQQEETDNQRAGG